MPTTNTARRADGVVADHHVHCGRRRCRGLVEGLVARGASVAVDILFVGDSAWVAAVGLPK